MAFQTRPDQADEAVRVSREVLRKFVADGPTEAELQAAKDNLIGGYPLRDPAQVLALLERVLPVRVDRPLPWWTTVESRAAR